MGKRKLPRPDDRVIVPVGSGEVEGRVTYVSPIFDPPRVQVEFKLDDDESPARNLYPLDMIRPAPAYSG